MPIIVYIAGHGRSGSTLLERLLGNLPGCINVGELRDIFLRGVLDNERCSCGRAFRSCDFWYDVGKLSFGGWSLELARTLVSGREASWPRRWADYASQSGQTAQRYVGAFDSLYRSISEVSGARIVIDSSKGPGHGLTLARYTACDLRVVQLVRDPRAVAFSAQKLVRRPTVTTNQGYGLFPRHRAYETAIRWNISNLGGTLLRHYQKGALMRYEDFTDRPNDSIQMLMSQLGLEWILDGLDIRGVIELPLGHAIAGNPVRLSSGAITIAGDREWEVAMAKHEKLIVSVITAPVRKLVKH